MEEKEIKERMKNESKRWYEMKMREKEKRKEVTN